jgi:nucleotide-binding universal stress UspA family protein
MKFLICIEGAQVGGETAWLGEELARMAKAELVKLRVLETQREADARPKTGSLIRIGAPIQEILAEAANGNYDFILTSLYHAGRLANFFVGTTAARLAKQASQPVLVVKAGGTLRSPLRRILICTGGEAPGEICAVWGGRLAAWTGADATLLHVMSQVALTDRAKVEDLEDTAEEAIRQGTREGLHLQKVVQLAKEAGAPGTVKPKIRHGLVLDEILAEVKEGDYDLVAIGAHYAPKGNPIGNLLLADLTDQLISRCPRNVLVVRKT